MPPTQLNARIPRDLETICLKCLRKEPGKRYDSAAALAEELGRFLRGEPITARPVGRFERTAKWVRRHKGLSAGLTAAVLALLLGTTVTTWQAVAASIAAANEATQRRAAEAEKKSADDARKLAQEEKRAADTARKNAEEEKQAADTAHKATDKALLQARQELRKFELMHYLDHIAIADKALRDNDFITARSHLDSCRWDFRHLEHAYLRKQLAQKEPLMLAGHTNSVSSLALSSDGKRLFSGSGDRTIKVWDLATGKETLTLRV